MSTIERIPITGADQWHALRARNVGASEAAALLGVHDYLTALELWAIKSGHQPAPQETPPMKRGRMLEPVAVEMIREECPQWQLERPAAYFTDTALQLGATPDLFATDPVHGLGVVQIKCVEPGAFRRNWWEADTLRPPIWVAVQNIVEAHLTGAKWGAIAALVVSHGIELHMVDVPLHEGVITKVRDATAEFWQLVHAGRRPPADYGRDLMVLRSLLLQDDATEIDLSGDNELPTILKQRADAQLMVKSAQARVDTTTAMILDKLGTARIGRLRDGGYISAATVNRKAHEVKASTFRQLRIVTKGEAA